MYTIKMPLPIKRIEKPLKTLGFQGFRWRRGWDSNPCDVAVKLISSQPRYDHFDTSPCMLTRKTEINANIRLY